MPNKINAQGRLQATHQILLNQLRFGERSGDAQAPNLAVKLAVALLALMALNVPAAQLFLGAPVVQQDVGVTPFAPWVNFGLGGVHRLTACPFRVQRRWLNRVWRTANAAGKQP